MLKINEILWVFELNTNTNFTPSQKMYEYAKTHNLKCKDNGYGKAIVKMQDKWYEYDHYNIYPMLDKENLHLILKEVK